MRTTSIKTIYLTQDELKEAIVHWLDESNRALACLVKDNATSIEFCGPNDELQILIDGEISDSRDEDY